VVAAAPAEGAPAPREDRGGRPPRERFAGKGRDGDKGRDTDRPKSDRPGDKGKFGGGRDKGGRDKGGGRDRDKGGRDSGPSHRQWASSAAPAPRERDRPIDPNSPFAKLAALKEQLSARKE
jgi:ATP-dependent RNA helicase SUPV3L1/SUV3